MEKILSFDEWVKTINPETKHEDAVEAYRIYRVGEMLTAFRKAWRKAIEPVINSMKFKIPQ